MNSDNQTTPITAIVAARSSPYHRNSHHVLHQTNTATTSPTHSHLRCKGCIMNLSKPTVLFGTFAGAFTLLAVVAPVDAASKPTTTTAKTVANLDKCAAGQNGARARTADGRTLTCRNLGFRWTEDAFSAPVATPAATKPGSKPTTPTTTIPIPKSLSGTFSGALVGGAIERKWEGTVTFAGPTAGFPRAYGLKTATVNWTIISKIPNCVGELSGVAKIDASGSGATELSVGGGLFILNADKTYNLGIRGALTPKPAFPCPDGTQTIDVDGNWELASSGPTALPLTGKKAVAEREDGSYQFKWDIPAA